MVAIFTDQSVKVSNIGHFTPKNNFRIIRDVQDIRGLRFSGIICIYGFQQNEEVAEAFEALKERQPELFKS